MINYVFIELNHTEFFLMKKVALGVKGWKCFTRITIYQIVFRKELTEGRQHVQSIDLVFWC